MEKILNQISITDKQEKLAIQSLMELVNKQKSSPSYSNPILFKTLDLLPAKIAYVDFNQRFQFANKAFGEKCCVAPNHLIGVSVCDVVGDFYEKIQSHINLALKGEPQTFDLRVVAPSEEERWTQTMYIPHTDENGETHGFVILIEDVLEPRNLKFQNERFRYAWDQSMEGFALLDSAGNYTHINHAHADIYGYSIEDLQSAHWHTLYQPEVIQEIEKEHFPALLETGKWRGELIGEKKCGGQVEVEVSLTLLTGQDGDSAGIACCCRDITKRKESEKALRQLQRIDALGQLTGGIAHDFNNLLTVITGSLDLVKRSSTEESNKLIQHALEASHKGSKLVQRLLSFARKQPLDSKALNASNVLQEMQSMLSRTIGGSIEIKVQSDPALWNCNLDQNQLESAILNLSLNARDAMPNGGKIQLSANNRLTDKYSSNNSTQEFVCISVKDSGCGMSPNTLESIFDPFFTTKEKGKGTGLGLSMVHGFVTQSSGFIEASSQPQNGTTIEMLFPRSATPSKDFLTKLGTKETHVSRLVLLVEDEESVRKVTKKLLVQLGYKVIALSTPGEAVQELQENNGIQLILSDMDLKDSLTGVDLVNKAQLLHPNMSAVLMTGYSSGISPKGVPILLKPFSMEQLENCVEGALNHRR